MVFYYTVILIEIAVFYPREIVVILELEQVNYSTEDTESYGYDSSTSPLLIKKKKIKMDLRHITYHYSEHLKCNICEQTLYYKERSTQCLVCGRFVHKYCARSSFFGSFNAQDLHVYSPFLFTCRSCRIVKHRLFWSTCYQNHYAWSTRGSTVWYLQMQN